MTFEEMLRANGASEEDLKVLNHPAARKAFEKAQADLEAAATEAATIKSQYADYQTKVTDWYNENNAALLKTKEYAVTQRAEAEKAKAALIEANRQGLFNAAKDMGYDPEPVKPAEKPSLDDRYLTADSFKNATEAFAANLTGMLDAAAEHARLFPNIPFNAEALRTEARSAGKTLLPYWEEKYKVREARASAEEKRRNDEIAKWKAEGAKEKEQQLASVYGNPETRPMVPSKSPFAVRKEDPLRADNHPWNKSETQLSNDRVARAARNLIEKQSSGGLN